MIILYGWLLEPAQKASHTELSPSNLLRSSSWDVHRRHSSFRTELKNGKHLPDEENAWLGLLIQKVPRLILPMPQKIQQGRLNRLYMMAFIDDRTRFIAHWATVPNKGAETSAEILRTALPWSQPLFGFGTDNGGEFIGWAFQQVLLEFNVKFSHTAPRTPEQNVKIERLWRTLEKSRKGSVDLRKITRDHQIVSSSVASSRAENGTSTSPTGLHTLVHSRACGYRSRYHAESCLDSLPWITFEWVSGRY
jgi:transposase InsO family protein